MKSNLDLIKIPILDKLKKIGLTDDQISSVVEIFNPALFWAVEVLYFEDMPAYQTALEEIVSILTGMVDPKHDDIEDLYKKLLLKL